MDNPEEKNLEKNTAESHDIMVKAKEIKLFASPTSDLNQQHTMSKSLDFRSEKQNESPNKYQPTSSKVWSTTIDSSASSVQLKEESAN